MVFGEELETYAEDAKLVAKLKAAKAGEGGEWKKHLQSEKQWRSFVTQVNKALVRKGAIFEVQVWQEWSSKIPAWHMGGKFYIQRYMKEYKGYFPEVVDPVFLNEATAEAMAHIEPQLASLDVYANEAAKITVLERKLAELEAKLAGNSASTGGRIKCNKCWVVNDHATENCPLSRKEAWEAREAIKAARAASTPAADGAANTSDGG